MEINIDEITDAISEAVTEKLEDVLEEKLEDILEEKLDDILEDKLSDAVEDAVESALSHYLLSSLNEALTNFEFVLKDGTVVRPGQHMRLLSPDKSKQLLCYGGMKVGYNSKSDNYLLHVQTFVNCWENIAAFSTREEALAKMQEIKAAMDSGAVSFEM